MNRTWSLALLIRHRYWRIRNNWRDFLKTHRTLRRAIWRLRNNWRYAGRLWYTRHLRWNMNHGFLFIPPDTNPTPGTKPHLETDEIDLGTAVHEGDVYDLYYTPSLRRITAVDDIPRFLYLENWDFSRVEGRYILPLIEGYLRLRNRSHDRPQRKRGKEQ